MGRDLGRLLRPRHIAVVGGGAWGAQVIRQAKLMGFDGKITLVRPKGGEMEGVKAVASLAEMQGVPDAVFVGVNRHLTVDVVRQLSAIGAGGVVCFASGFSEALAEEETAGELQAALVAAAGEMPILGPNCYGFINALDGALLWPDQHGCARQETGVAILTQSSNIAINLTMQQRALPIGYVVTCGNMAQQSQAEIAMSLLEDTRVTAIGVHIEGFGDTAAWHAFAVAAAKRGVPVVALKVGKSDQAQQATVSHTASLAGSDAGASALLDRLAIGRAPDLPSFLETLKLMHFVGRLDAPTLSSISCSGGEASLCADTAHGGDLSFPALTEEQRAGLAEALGPMVALANPLDYNTYIWRDTEKMVAAWLPMAAEHIGLTLIIVDYPVTDAADWECATNAALEVRRLTGRPIAMVATLPELLPLEVAERLAAGGVVPMNGLSEAIIAAELAAKTQVPVADVPLSGGTIEQEAKLLNEHSAKAALTTFGISVPNSGLADDAAQVEQVAQTLKPPLVLKAVGVAHKSDSGGVVLNVTSQTIGVAAVEMQSQAFLIEEMVVGGIVELLVGVTRDPAHGFVLTLGAGGVLTELWQDTQSLLVPSEPPVIRAALRRLRIWPLLEGYRGKQGADLDSIIAAIKGVQDYVIAHADSLTEVEINPLICTADAAIAADALIYKT